MQSANMDFKTPKGIRDNLATVISTIRRSEILITLNTAEKVGSAIFYINTT